ncbi:hypothetical protein LCGC14_2660810 [marine sediment metagenome]|uniref:Cytochrome b/b6 N-terminal region profile domain-containing protein n=1 Tax=marine sediment metagenome TaxID=412755 RepID=A0A0F8ZS04_9ZZZZ
MTPDSPDIDIAGRMSALWAGAREMPRLWSYYVGGAAASLLGLQVITGCLLLLHYQPSVRDAHASVAAIATDIPLGWIVRSVHHTSSNVLVALVMVHAFHVLWAKAFRAKRALTYYTGGVLLAAVLFMCFTGYLLPWDTLSVSATAVATGLPGDIPWVGPLITEFFRAGPSVGPTTLSRFFGFHVSAVPMALALGLLFHILCIRRHGMRRPRGPGARRVRFVPDYLLRQGRLCLWLIAGILTWAILAPTQLRPEGDPMAPAVEGIMPEWYFMAVYQVVKFGGELTFLSAIGITAELLTLIVISAGCAVMVLMPVLDRKGRGRIWKGVVLLAAGAFVILTAASMLTSQPPEAAPEVADALSIARSRTAAYLIPLWLTVLALTWLLSAAIRLYDRITASALPAKIPKV